MNKPNKEDFRSNNLMNGPFNQTKYAIELEKYIKYLEGMKTSFLPLSLTHENGSKNLLRGEFKEKFEDQFDNTIEVDVSWSTIKDIYKKVVAHFMLNPSEEYQKEQRYEFLLQQLTGFHYRNDGSNIVELLESAGATKEEVIRMIESKDIDWISKELFNQLQDYTN